MQLQNSLRILFISAIVLLNSVCQAAIVFSEPTNGLYIGVTSLDNLSLNETNWITNNIPIKYNDELVILYFCKTGSINLEIPLNKEFLVRFRLRDKYGKDVNKTPLGELWGDQIQNFPSKPGMSSRDRMLPWQAGSFSIPPSVGPLIKISTDKLFDIKERGVYDLTLEVHLMEQHIFTNNWAWDHVAIPPVTIKIEKL